MLAGYTSSSGQSGSVTGPYEPSGDPDDPNYDADTLDVGSLATSANNQTCIRTLPVSLRVDTETTVIGSGNDTSGNPNDGIADEVEIPQFVNDFVTPDRNSNLIVDFGVFKPYSLGNRVWLDSNDNGLIDAVEPGLPGVTARLYSITNTALATTTTDGLGYYRFDFLSTGGYVVEVQNPVNPNPLPASPYGYMRSSTIDGSGSVDSDDNGETAATVNGVPATRSAIVAVGNVGSGDIEPVSEADIELNLVNAASNARYNATLDFGFYEPVQIGSRIFDDQNNDGKRVSGERNGIVSATLKLYRFDPVGGIAGTCGYQTPVSTTRPSTASATFSDWFFTDLAPGSYVVEVVLDPEMVGFISSSGANGSPGKGPYEDPNGSVTDPNDGFGGGINNDDNGWTCANGRTVTRPFVATSRDENALDSVTNPNVNNTLDIAFFKPLSLGNLVWNDLNNNGMFDANEPPIAGARMNLGWDKNNDGVVDAAEMAAPILTTTTDANGLYLFRGLGSGNYVVELDAINFASGAVLFGYRSSTGATLGQTGPFEAASDPDTNTADNKDNGTFVAALKSIQSDPVTLKADTEPKSENPTNDAGTADASSNLTVDFGVFQPFSLGNRVWLDTDSNAKVSTDERGAANIFVNLFSRDGALRLAQTSTDASGYYRFDGLRTGEYRVEIDAGNFITTNPKFPPFLLRYVSTHPDDSTGNSDVDSTDNGIGVSPNVSAGITSDWMLLNPGGAEPVGERDLVGGVDPQGAEDAFANMTIDFGVHMTATLGNRVWVDSNKNGQWDVGESPVPNIVITLYISNTLVATTTTDATGIYTFENISPNTYVVGLQLPAGFTFTTIGSGNTGEQNRINPVTGRSPPIVLGVGEINMTADIGIIVNPTAILLSRFVAVAQSDNSIRVEWRTAMERETFGFLVLRGDSDDVAQAVKVSPELILATGGNSGASYTFIDSNADVSRRYRYWLREIEVNGSELTYGPAVVGGVSVEVQPVPILVANAGGVPVLVAPIPVTNQSSAPAPVTSVASVATGAQVQPNGMHASDVVVLPGAAQEPVLTTSQTTLPEQQAQPQPNASAEEPAKQSASTQPIDTVNTGEVAKTQETGAQPQSPQVEVVGVERVVRVGRASTITTGTTRTRPCNRWVHHPSHNSLHKRTQCLWLLLSLLWGCSPVALQGLSH